MESVDRKVIESGLTFPEKTMRLLKETKAVVGEKAIIVLENGQLLKVKKILYVDPMREHPFGRIIYWKGFGSMANEQITFFAVKEVKPST